jgi:hypothetical protein
MELTEATAYKVQLVPLALRVLLALPARAVLPAKMEKLDHKVLLAIQVDQLVLPVIKVPKVLPVPKVPKVLPVLKVPRE